MSDTEYRYVAARGVERKRSHEQGDRPSSRERWAEVDAEYLHGCNAAELRKIADAMDGGTIVTGTIVTSPLTFDSPVGGASTPDAPRMATDEEAAVALLRRWAADPGASGDGYIRLTPCEANHVLNALDRETASADNWRRISTHPAMDEKEDFWRKQYRDLTARIRDLEAQVAHYRLSWESAERTIKALRNELRDQLTDARSEAVSLRATEENLKGEVMQYREMWQRAEEDREKLAARLTATEGGR